MNELAVNLLSKRVDHAYLKVLIVGEATVAPVLGKLFAVDDRLSVGAELNADAISHRNAVFHIKEKSLHGIIPWLCEPLAKPWTSRPPRNQPTATRIRSVPPAGPQDSFSAAAGVGQPAGGKLAPAPLPRGGARLFGLRERSAALSLICIGREADACKA